MSPSSQKKRGGGGEAPTDESFWSIIRSLAHQGIYLEDPRSEGSCISHSVLASTVPFNQVRDYLLIKRLYFFVPQSLHCVLLEGFMLFYSLKLAPISQIVKAVRYNMYIHTCTHYMYVVVYI